MPNLIDRMLKTGALRPTETFMRAVNRPFASNPLVMSGIEIPILIGFFIALPIFIVWGIWKAFSRSVFLGFLVIGLIVAASFSPSLAFC